jgi:uncharacterized protein
MGNSLQEQLLKAGLVNEQQAKQTRAEKRKQQAPTRRNEAGALDPRLQAQQVQAEKAQRDRELNRKREEEAKRREIAAQIRQLIAENRVKGREGDVAFHFPDGPRLKHIYVTAAIQRQLSQGSLAITRLDGRYELVPLAVAEKIRARDPSRILAGHPDQQPLAEAPGAGDAEDPYKDFKIPDDLLW